MWAPRASLGGVYSGRTAWAIILDAGLEPIEEVVHVDEATLVNAAKTIDAEGRPGLTGTIISPTMLVDAHRHSPNPKDTLRRILSYLRAFSRAVDRAERALTRPDNGDVSRQALRQALEEVPPPEVEACMTLADYVTRKWVPLRSGAVKDPDRVSGHPKMWAKESGLWTNHLLPGLGHYRLSQLDARKFDNFITQFRLKDGRPPSGATKRLVRAAYQALLQVHPRSTPLQPLPNLRIGVPSWR